MLMCLRKCGGGQNHISVVRAVDFATDFMDGTVFTDKSAEFDKPFNSSRRIQLLFVLLVIRYYHHAESASSIPTDRIRFSVAGFQMIPHKTWRA